ncbi:hypothetical protein ABIF38_006389 [Bradyrhizobium japonicum]|uniref:hypothetical protein n=1 Tax=Bradyrhizobium elkanii TaxID=29448 RepID=UPI00036C10A4|nr:hypothetical protein [Bradyrhizobium elkanii]WAX24320.1 hypothetical protein [Bradyrhizobium phage ppBeUSDA76-1]MCP1731303.1 hypothetical protein [Bradyrhizobium elkanii]MCS3575432.1 hypothetical protein [Bradyrhizobium elkanii]MCS3591877.1 hypothetical protein [Bradyrhizobium elkanii]MCS3621322.1 hypothetical protein [Bradyrhizobium elkanii]
MSGTALYQRTIAFNYGTPGRGEIMREVWTPTPWMLDVYVGDRYAREDEILRWCYAELGEMSSPIHGRAGCWHRGSATIFGWTWFGFADEATMQRFAARWPTPDGVKHPEAA